MKADARIALLFPGQGSQHVGMGLELAEQFPAARRVWEEADDALGFAVSRLCWHGPEVELTLTSNAQPAILAHSAAAWAVVRERLGDRVVGAAGHSLGEFAAYFAAGSLAFRDALRTVRRRGELMLATGEQRPGTMAAVLGLDDAVAGQICRAASEDGECVVPANFNAPGQIVLSGDPAAVERAGDAARGAGARRVLPLNVSGAFHSPLMQPAEPALRACLEETEILAPRFPVVSNVTAATVSEAADARELLIRQLTSPVRWTESVRTLLGLGPARFLEIGPGAVLSGLLRRIDRGAQGRSLGTAEEVETFLREED